MSEEEQGAALLRAIKQDKDVRRRIACRGSNARTAAILLDALTNPWGLDFDQLRQDAEPFKNVTIGQWIEDMEKDVKMTTTLKDTIDKITNP